MKQKIFVMVVFCLLAFSVPQARAQFEKNDLSFSLMFGSVFFDLTREYRDLWIDLPPRQVWTLGVEYTLVPRIGIEILAGFNPNDFDAPSYVGYELDHWYLAGNVVLRLNPSGSFNPYLSVGPGITLMKPQNGGVVTEPTLQAGAGFDLFGSETWAVRVDARFFTYPFRSGDFDPIVLSDTGIDPNFDRRVWDFVLMAGIRWNP